MALLPLGSLGVGAALVVGSLCCATPLRAQEIVVPVAVQIPILIKILNFDRKLPERMRDRVVVGVLFQGRYRTSAHIAEEACRNLRDLPAGAVGTLELKCVNIDLDDTPALDSTLKREQINVLYVSPLRAVPLKDVIAASRAAGITTLTGVPRYVETGLAIGLDMKGERPEILVNLSASRAEGADLTAHLLKLARLVGQGEEPGR